VGAVGAKSNLDIAVVLTRNDEPHHAFRSLDTNPTSLLRTQFFDVQTFAEELIHS
jgi:hypothetical protein